MMVEKCFPPVQFPCPGPRSCMGQGGPSPGTGAALVPSQGRTAGASGGLSSRALPAAGQRTPRGSRADARGAGSRHRAVLRGSLNPLGGGTHPLRPAGSTKEGTGSAGHSPQQGNTSGTALPKAGVLWGRAQRCLPGDPQGVSSPRGSGSAATAAGTGTGQKRRGSRGEGRWPLPSRGRRGCHSE